MKSLFDKFRNYQTLKEAGGRRHKDIVEYSLNGVLIITKRSKRLKEDVLSNIRSIEGVTTVTILDHRVSDTLNFSEIRVKVDADPLQHKDPLGVGLYVKKEILKIRGVQSFRITTKPERI